MIMKPYLKLFILAMFTLGIFQPSFAEEPLPPDDAFKLKVSFKDKNTLVAELAPAKNHYLYKNKVRFAVENPSGALFSSRKFGFSNLRHASPITESRVPSPVVRRHR